jgi:prophage tail gpP-like protein
MGITVVKTLPKMARLPVAKDIAILEVNNKQFTNWTTINVQARYTEAFPIFTFECTEDSPVPLKIEAAQFVPGDVVKVYLGGIQVVYGYITERHVAYDARNHGVRIVGTGDTADLVNSMVPLEKLNGHDGKSVYQIAQDISAHLGISIYPVDAVDNDPFDNVQIQPGETIMAVIERYARMRKIVIGSNPTGGLLLIGDGTAVSSGELVEGHNILRANVAIRDDRIYKRLFAIGQGTGSDAASGDSQNKQVAYLDGTSTRNRFMITVADIADKMHGIEQRVAMEKVFTEGSHIEANLTVQGWFKDFNRSDALWRAGECYIVRSPSLILNQLLGCAGCTYEQSDGGGTTTTLQMVDLQHMNKKFNFRLNIPDITD